MAEGARPVSSVLMFALILCVVCLMCMSSIVSYNSMCINLIYSLSFVKEISPVP